MIPKNLHVIWIGDENKKPEQCISSWKDKNSSFNFKLWGNDELKNTNWKNRNKIQDMLNKKDYAGVSDIMRYEILFNHGGVYVDADSYCIKPLEDWLLDCQAFACWEQEIIKNNLISNAYIGGVKNASVWKLCIDEVSKTDCTQNKQPWLVTGPKMLSDLYFKHQPDLTVYPSHFFIQTHHTGYKTNVTGHYFANQLWGSVNGYSNMDSRKETNESIRK
jgi:mannosyltransferase OCH1-like enzyme